MSQLVSFGKTHLVAGLYWSRLQSTQRKRSIIKAELDDLAYEYENVHGTKPNIGAIYSTGLDLLLGIGEQSSKDSGASRKGKVRSLISVALGANDLTRSFLGRIRLTEDKEWFAVVRSGVVSPVGDLVVDRDEADEAFDILCKRNNDLPVLFNETELAPSEELIRGWLSSVSLRKVATVKELTDLGAPPLTPKKVLVYGLITSVFFSGIYFGFSEYQNYVERKEAEAKAARLAEMARRNIGGPIPTPWEDWSEVAIVAAACLSHYLERDEYKYGWQAVTWDCDGKTVTQVWRRTEIGAYSHLPVKEGFSLTEPNQITHTEELGLLLAPRGEESIAPKKQVAKVLMDAARVHGMAISLEWGNEESRSYMQGEEKKVEYFGYSRNTATISGKDLASLSIVKTLRNIPGLHISRLHQEGAKFEIDIAFYTAV